MESDIFVLMNQRNFFKHTYCEFKHTTGFDFSVVQTFTSKSGSVYHYTEKGVYRYANHWGRVANCRWRLKGVANYSSQKWYVGYANWSDFYDITSSDKICSLHVDFQSEKVGIYIDQSASENLFSIVAAIRRKKEIEAVFKNPKWLQYYTGTIKEIKRNIIFQLQNTSESLQHIKLQQKSS